MNITLATTWNPRGELSRLRRFMPQLSEIYDDIVLSLPPDVNEEIKQALEDLPVQYHVTEKWGQGRYRCVQKAVETAADTIHYVDADRLIRWVELRPEELRQTVDFIQKHDCVVIGRTEAAWDTHPRTLYHTEKIINDTFSYILGGETLDFGAGSKAFSRRAAQFLVKNGSPDYGLGTDTEWTVLLHRAGFGIVDLRVDGLDWETADRDRESAADDDLQRQMAEKIDQDAERWTMRVRVAQQMADAGLDALQKPLTGFRYLEIRRHTMRIKPGQRLSQSGVQLARRIGATMGEFDRVISSTIPRAYETAIAMGYAVDEQYDELCQIMDGVEEDVGSWDAGFGAYGKALANDGPTAKYARKLAEFYRSVVEALPDGGSALVINHGGIVEAGAVGCMPDAEHESWGRYADYCEGVCLTFDGEKFIKAEILRVE